MPGATGPIRSGLALAAGRYLLEEQIGQGGMAAVFKAHDTALNRTVAVKTMLAALAHDEGLRARFRREAQSAARLSHPSVVAVHDTGEERFEDGVRIPYLVMEFVRGGTLGELLARDAAPGRGLPPDRALALSAEVLAALTASHAAGVVHRDIKPSNVVVTADGRVKVMDFGIARILDVAEQGSPRTALTAVGDLLGTPYYMAPEQFDGRGRVVDGRADLYAVGVMLFQLISGRLPFEGDSGFSLGYLHVTVTAPTLASVGCRVPDPIEELVARALEKRPEDRFRDAHEMRAYIEHVRESANAPAPAPDPYVPPTPPPPTTSPIPPQAPTPIPAPAAPVDPARERADNRLRARRLRHAYGLLIPAFLLQAATRSFAVLPLAFAVWGLWAAAVGGTSRLGQQRGATLGFFQATAFIPLLGHLLLILVSLTRLSGS
ncbi:protein kinase domain-containing protein [Streptomyces paludis]|uniref:protein kinase domain-containing protein n=1 Tax=Streptomyces paludis TaxID=2282738 RepID=UPI001E64205E|nr:protein kinase [Streptomyces paludis]